jgi:outer membrane protein
MRTVLVATMALAGIGGFLTPDRAEAQKIGYVHSDRAIAEAPGADSVRSQMQQEVQRTQNRLGVLQDSLEMLGAELQRQSVMLSPEERRKREDALRQRGAAMQQRMTILQQELDNRQQELMGPILKRVEDAIEAVRKEGGYGIIFDASARVMVAADTTLDLTNTVIAKLKAAAPAGTTGGTTPRR